MNKAIIPNFRKRPTAFLAAVLSAMLSATTSTFTHPAAADTAVKITSDTWVSDLVGQENINFEANVNPSTQIRNDSTVRRVAFHQFTLPPIGPHETITGVEFRTAQFDTGTTFLADFGRLNTNPNLAAITYQSAVNAGFLAAGNDSGQNAVIGPNTTLAGETWSVTGQADGTALHFVDNDVSNGFGKLVADVAGPSPQQVTLMLKTVDPTPSNSVGLFYGRGNSESVAAPNFFPHPRVTVRTAITPTDVVVASKDTWIASNLPTDNFEVPVEIPPDDPPSSQLRNSPDVTRASFYRFTLPQLNAGESIGAASFNLLSQAEGINNHFAADFALLSDNPDLSTITWNSALSSNYITGLDGNFNPILGANATAANANWSLIIDNTDPQNPPKASFTDGDASNGLAQLIAGRASTSGPVDITLMLVPRGAAPDTVLASFYGLENTELDPIFPHPRLGLKILGGVNAFTWTAGVNGNWNVGGNWSPGGGPPGAGDTATINSNGTTVVNVTGNETADNTTLSAGRLRISAGGSLTSPVAMSGGTIDGGGTLNGTLSSTGGTISPGTSAGRLTVNGNVTMGATSTLRIELGGANASRVAGTDYDQLKATGTAAVAGTLDVQSLPGLVDLGSSTAIANANRGKAATFTIVDTDGGLSGTFATRTFNGSALNAENGKGIFKSTSVAGNDLVFTIMNAKVGDADGDRIVSATDVFTAVNNLGPAVAGSGWTSGNFDLDGLVSATDVFNAVNALGVYTPVPTSGAISSVPEPASLWLVGMAAALMAVRARRRDRKLVGQE